MATDRLSGPCLDEARVRLGSCRNAMLGPYSRRPRGCVRHYRADVLGSHVLHDNWNPSIGRRCRSNRRQRGTRGGRAEGGKTKSWRVVGWSGDHHGGVHDPVLHSMDRPARSSVDHRVESWPAVRWGQGISYKWLEGVGWCGTHRDSGNSGWREGRGCIPRSAKPAFRGGGGVSTMPIEGPGDPGNQPLDPHDLLPDLPARPGQRDQRRSAAIGPASLRLRIRPRNGGSACSTTLCTGSAGERTGRRVPRHHHRQQQLRRSGGVRCHTWLGCGHRTGHAQRRKAYPSPSGEVRPLLEVSGNRQERVVFSFCPC
jgi:hypothetical protein